MILGATAVAAPAPALTVVGVDKRFGARHAGRDVGFPVADGELLFDDTPAALKDVAGADAQHDREQAFVSLLRTRGH